MKPLLAASLVTLASCAAPRAAHWPGDQVAPGRDLGVVKDEYARTAMVLTLCGDGSLLAGTAVAVGGGAFLTALHVVDCAPDEVSIALPGSEPADVELEAATRADVARLRVVDPVRHFGPVTIARPPVGAAACVVSAVPERGRKCGEVNPDGSDGPETEMSLSVVAEHGMSGAGAWDEDGALLGIVTQIRPCGGNSKSSCGARGAWLAPMDWVAFPSE